MRPLLDQIVAWGCIIGSPTFLVIAIVRYLRREREVIRLWEQRLPRTETFIRNGVSYTRPIRNSQEH